MVPGKKYTPDDYVSVVWRRKWFVLIPLVLCTTAMFLYSRSLPNSYRSEALLLVIPQQIPEKMVAPVIGNPLTLRLDLMRRQILSRNRLEQLIYEFDLYPEQRKTMVIDQVVEVMKNAVDVRIQPVPRRESPNYFTVTYDYSNPLKTMQVADRLASAFVKENMEGRSVQTDVTLQFLQRQVDDALRQLKEQEGRLTAFRQANTGQLPDEVNASIQMMSNVRQQIQSLNDDINRDRERQIVVERLIAEESASAPALPVARPGGPADMQTSLSAAQQLAGARAVLDATLLRLKEDHPDVRILRNQIKDLERRAEAEALQQPLGQATSVAALTPADAFKQKRLAQLQAELQAIERASARKQAGLKRAEATLAEQERRVHAAPGRQSELSDLSRGYDTLKANHDGLFAKLQNARLSTRLEEEQISQQFRIVDPPRRPSRPRTPDRVRMNVIGAIAGLGLGLLVVGLLEYRDTSLRTDEDVLVALSLPVLALVPTMEAQRRRRWRGLLVGSSALALLLSAAARKLQLLAMWSR